MTCRLYKGMLLSGLLSVLVLAGTGCSFSVPDGLITRDEDSGTGQTETDPQTSQQQDDQEPGLVTVSNASELVSLGRYKGLVLARPAVSDEEVEEEIRSRLEEEASPVSGSDAVVQEGDTVVINYVGTIGYETFDGSVANNYRLTVGSDQMQEGFEQALIGMKTGETRSFALPYTESGEDGLQAVYRVTLQAFYRPSSLTQDWAAAHGASTVDEYREQVRKEMEEQIDVQKVQREDAWQRILSQSSLSLFPERDLTLAGEEYREIMEEYARDADMTLDEFLSSQGMSAGDFETQQLSYAQGKVLQNMVVQVILDQEGISLSDRLVQAAMESVAAEAGFKNVDALISSVGNTRALESAALRVVQDLAVEEASASADS